MKTKLVALIGLINENNEVLISLRKNRSHYNNLWEFPGGKVDKEECLIEALEREIFEELGITLDFNKIYYLNNYKILKQNISLHFLYYIRFP